RRRLITLRSGTLSVPAGQTASVTVRLSPETAGRFRMVITDPAGKACDTKYISLASRPSSQPFVVKYRTLDGLRVTLGDTRAKDEAARAKAVQAADTQADLLKSCGFTTEVQSLIDRPTPQRPAAINRILLFAQLEQTQTRRFSSLVEAQKFADAIRACNSQ